MKSYKILFLAGSQNLYGSAALDVVNNNLRAIVEGLNASSTISCTIVYLPCLTDSGVIEKSILMAENDPDCAGIITWMHTFSPSKMWISGLKRLTKPYLHLNTQYNRDIPWETIDMDFMNLNQSAHGDREHGYIAARLGLPRKVIAGHWQDDRVRREIDVWMRAAVGALESNRLKILRISDNMRDVAVTEGDKIEAQIKLGWQVDHYGITDIENEMKSVSRVEAEAVFEEYSKDYLIDTDNIDSVKYQAKIEAAIKKFLKKNGYGAFHTNFQDLGALKQLPGLAVQNLMKKGFGFGAEGDWKVAALTRIMKLMSKGLQGGTSFIEDYTYHFEPGNEMLLGAHMLEVCPSIADDKPKIQVHPLGIGDREPPARAVFKAKAGKAIVASLVDMGYGLRMIVNDIECQKQKNEIPHLPVASALWKPFPDLKTSAQAWILSGAAHHSVLSYDLTAEHMRDFCEMKGIEFLHINKNTEILSYRKELELSEFLWKKKK